MKNTLRTIRGLAIFGGVAALTLTGAAGAAAHVTVTPTVTEAGAYTVLTFSVPHGCEGSSTTEVAIKMPESIISVTPTVNPSWDVSTVMVELPEPVADGHGGQYTERVGQVVYTAKTPLADGLRDTFELSLRLPEGEPGEVLNFPTVQTCEQGESAWIQIPADGQDGEELDLPAPSFALTAAESDNAADGDADSSAEPVDSEESDSTTPVAAEGDDDSGATMGLAVTGLVAGVLGMIAGGAAFARSRRS